MVLYCIRSATIAAFALSIFMGNGRSKDCEIKAPGVMPKFYLGGIVLIVYPHPKGYRDIWQNVVVRMKHCLIWVLHYSANWNRWKIVQEQKKTINVNKTFDVRYSSTLKQSNMISRA